MHTRFVFLIFCSCLAIASSGFADDSTTVVPSENESRGYRIEQPGTITFTVGVKIKGKVEKPQVVIFLPKEKPLYREMEFSHSFKEDIEKPLSFKPVTE